MGDRPANGDPGRGRRYCPACRAPRREGTVCHRCKSDLGLLVRLEQQADTLQARAERCYARGWYRQAAALAEASQSLEASPDRRKLLACSRLMCGDFPGAWKAHLRTARGDAQPADRERDVALV